MRKMRILRHIRFFYAYPNNAYFIYTIHHHPQPIPRGALEARTGNYEKLN